MTKEQLEKLEALVREGMEHGYLAPYMMHSQGADGTHFACAIGMACRALAGEWSEAKTTEENDGATRKVLDAIGIKNPSMKLVRIYKKFDEIDDLAKWFEWLREEFVR